MSSSDHQSGRPTGGTIRPRSDFARGLFVFPFINSIRRAQPGPMFIQISPYSHPHPPAFISHPHRHPSCTRLPYPHIPRHTVDILDPLPTHPLFLFACMPSTPRRAPQSISSSIIQHPAPIHRLLLSLPMNITPRVHSIHSTNLSIPSQTITTSAACFARHHDHPASRDTGQRTLAFGPASARGTCAPSGSRQPPPRP